MRPDSYASVSFKTARQRVVPTSSRVMCDSCERSVSSFQGCLLSDSGQSQFKRKQFIRAGCFSAYKKRMMVETSFLSSFDPAQTDVCAANREKRKEFTSGPPKADWTTCKKKTRQTGCDTLETPRPRLSHDQCHATTRHWRRQQACTDQEKTARLLSVDEKKQHPLASKPLRRNTAAHKHSSPTEDVLIGLLLHLST